MRISLWVFLISILAGSAIAQILPEDMRSGCVGPQLAPGQSAEQELFVVPSDARFVLTDFTACPSPIAVEAANPGGLTVSIVSGVTTRWIGNIVVIPAGVVDYWPESPQRPIQLGWTTGLVVGPNETLKVQLVSDSDNAGPVTVYVSWSGYLVPLSTSALDIDGRENLVQRMEAWPIPSSNQVEFAFELRATTAIVLEIVDVAGRQVRVLDAGTLPKGMHAVVWDGNDESAQPVAPGIYFARLETPGESQTRKIVWTE